MKLESWTNYSCSTLLCTESNKQSLRWGQKDKYKHRSGLQLFIHYMPVAYLSNRCAFADVFSSFLPLHEMLLLCTYYIYLYVMTVWKDYTPPKNKILYSRGILSLPRNWIIMVCLGNHEDIQTAKIRRTFCSIYKKGHCLYIFRKYIQGMPYPAFCSSSQEIWVSEYLDC